MFSKYITALFNPIMAHVVIYITKHIWIKGNKRRERAQVIMLQPKQIILKAVVKIQGGFSVKNVLMENHWDSLSDRPKKWTHKTIFTSVFFITMSIMHTRAFTKTPHYKGLSTNLMCNNEFVRLLKTGKYVLLNTSILLFSCKLNKLNEKKGLYPSVW